MDFPRLPESAPPFLSTGSNQAVSPSQLSLASCLSPDGTLDVDKYRRYTAYRLAKARGRSEAILSTMFVGGESHVASVEQQGRPAVLPPIAPPSPIAAAAVHLDLYAAHRDRAARRETKTTTMATGDDDNDVNGDGTTGNEVDDDGDGATGDNNDDDDDGGDDVDGDGNSTMGSGATGYDNDNDGDGRRRQRRRWRRHDGQRSRR